LAWPAIFVTGSTEGLGRAAAETLIKVGHQVVVHARNSQRSGSLSKLTGLGAEVVIGDLASEQETRALADQVNGLGRTDAIIHNAAVYADQQRPPTPERHPRTLAVNALAPYLLTGLLERPDRLSYLTSDMHLAGDASLHDIDWTARRWNGVQPYCDSKLFVTALAFAVARRWPCVYSNAVDPGWVPTRMGGPSAPDDLELGHLTQVWLATSGEPEAMVSGACWHHRRRQAAAVAASEDNFQDRLLETLTRRTRVALP
jgi:NAD(P)-dependent dehydrogenase (short-subunit alcohol dehydrogenase family)